MHVTPSMLLITSCIIIQKSTVEKLLLLFIVLIPEFLAFDLLIL